MTAERREGGRETETHCHRRIDGPTGRQPDGVCYVLRFCSFLHSTRYRGSVLPRSVLSSYRTHLFLVVFSVVLSLSRGTSRARWSRTTSYRRRSCLSTQLSELSLFFHALFFLRVILGYFMYLLVFFFSVVLWSAAQSGGVCPKGHREFFCPSVLSAYLLVLFF